MTYSASPMKSKGLTPKPEYAKSWCPTHAMGASFKGWICQKCATDLAPNRALSREAGCAGGSLTPSTPAISKRRSGGDAEDGLARQFEIAGWIDSTNAEPFDSLNVPHFRRQHPWGLALTPRRGFAADFAFLPNRLLVEVTGGAHAAGRGKWKSDTERSGLAASIGWTICLVTPEQVRDGSALELVKRAIESAPRGAERKS